MRFTKARYKWFKGASEYTYYTITSPKDSKIVIWNENDFVTID